MHAFTHLTKLWRRRPLAVALPIVLAIVVALVVCPVPIARVAARCRAWLPRPAAAGGTERVGWLLLGTWLRLRGGSVGWPLLGRPTGRRLLWARLPLVAGRKGILHHAPRRLHRDQQSGQKSSVKGSALLARCTLTRLAAVLLAQL